jgi:phage FluMu protein Com
MANSKKDEIKIQKDAFPRSIEVKCSSCGKINYVDSKEATDQNYIFVPCDCGRMVQIQDLNSK